MQVSECPQCGAPGRSSEHRCTYCKAEFFITSVAYLGGFDEEGVGKYLKYYNGLVQADPNSTEGLLGLSICYLRAGEYALANMRLSRLVEYSPDCAPAYYYNALVTIRGRRLKTLNLSEVRSIESHLALASAIDPSRPEFKLLLAMVKRDYYETNGMRVSPPTSGALLAELGNSQVLRAEVSQLLKSAKVSNEEVYLSTLDMV